MVIKIRRENLLELPTLVLKRVGLCAGDYVEVTDDGYKIIITPKLQEEPFTAKEWEKIRSIARGKKGRAHKNGQALQKHLEKLSKK